MIYTDYKVSGEPLDRQRRRVKATRRRNPLVRKIRCALKKHNPPHKKFFILNQMVYIGGPCTEQCGDSVKRAVTWVGTTEDFDKQARELNRGLQGAIGDFIDALNT